MSKYTKMLGIKMDTNISYNYLFLLEQTYLWSILDLEHYLTQTLNILSPNLVTIPSANLT